MNTRVSLTAPGLMILLATPSGFSRSKALDFS